MEHVNKNHAAPIAALLEEAQQTYRQLYEDQLEGADEDYAEDFKARFAPGVLSWESIDMARCNYQALLDELSESRCDFSGQADPFGVADIAAALGLRLRHE